MHFRPEDDPHPGGPVEWADNAVSNTMAFASRRITPSWCQTEEHWTSRLTQYLFTDCPCCLLFRGLTVGIGIGIVIGIWIAATVALVALA